MTYLFHIRTPSTAAVQVDATVQVDDNRPARTEVLRRMIAEFYQVPTMWVYSQREYNDLPGPGWEIGENALMLSREST